MTGMFNVEATQKELKGNDNGSRTRQLNDTYEAAQKELKVFPLRLRGVQFRIQAGSNSERIEGSLLV